MIVQISIEVDDRAADDELIGGLPDDAYEAATEFKVQFSSDDLGKLNLSLLGNLTAAILGKLAEQNAKFDIHVDEPQVGDLLHETADMLGYQLK